MSEIFNKNMKVNDHIDWRAMYDTMKADRDRLLSIIPCGDAYEELKDDRNKLKAMYEAVKADRDRMLTEERTCYRVGSTLCCTCGARGEDTNHGAPLSFLSPPTATESRGKLRTDERIASLEDRVSKLEAAKGGET